MVANGDGSFTGEHTTDDTLVLVNYLQGANAGPEIKVINWDPSCPKADSNNPQEGDCAAKNLRLLRSVENALCGNGGDDVCAVTNDSAMPSPWPYVPKDGTSGEFPPESFYEGGINLSQLVGPVCFTSFMAESRSSSSFTASLKDFVLHNIEVCGLGLAKQCTSGTVDASETGFDYGYDGTVTNTGFGMLYDVVVIDDMGTPENPDDDITHTIGDLAAGASQVFGGTFWHTDNPATNRALARAAVQPGGQQRIVSEQAVATCPQVDRDPRISVTKSCKSELVAQEGKVVVQIGFEGQVCNDTGTDEYPAISLLNVVVK